MNLSHISSTSTSATRPHLTSHPTTSSLPRILLFHAPFPTPPAPTTASLASSLLLLPFLPLSHLPQLPDSRITSATIPHLLTMYTRLSTTRIASFAYFTLATEISTCDVEAVNVGWEDAGYEEKGIDKAVGTGTSDEEN